MVPPTLAPPPISIHVKAPSPTPVPIPAPNMTGGIGILPVNEPENTTLPKGEGLVEGAATAAGTTEELSKEVPVVEGTAERVTPHSEPATPAPAPGTAVVGDITTTTIRDAAPESPGVEAVREVHKKDGDTQEEKVAPTPEAMPLAIEVKGTTEQGKNKKIEAEPQTAAASETTTEGAESVSSAAAAVAGTTGLPHPEETAKEGLGAGSAEPTKTDGEAASVVAVTPQQQQQEKQEGLSTPVKVFNEPSSISGTSTTSNIAPAPAPTTPVKKESAVPESKGTPSSISEQTESSLGTKSPSSTLSKAEGKRKKRDSIFGKIKRVFSHHHSKEGSSEKGEQ